MRVIHLSYADILGGASRAAYRIHRSLIEENIDSKMWVNKVFSDDSTVEGPSTRIKKLLIEIKPRLINNLLLKVLSKKKKFIQSPSVFPSNWVKLINKSDIDIVNLHWIQNEMISIKDISKIKKPIVWTLHDMWAFCGAEHYTNHNRWREGYNFRNRDVHDSGFDLNQWTWKRKQKYWKNPIQIITPSKWLANCVNESKLMSHWPLSIIAYPLDTDVFKPIDKKSARKQLNLPLDIPLVLFGTDDVGDFRKGFDLLNAALENLKTTAFELVVFGERKKILEYNFSFPIHYMGHISDDTNLQLIYNSADVMIVPSRQDNLPNIALEAQSCGLPIVAFNLGGLPDIIEHKKTGYLVEAFNTNDLANGISYALDKINKTNLEMNARKKALEKYSPKTIARKYISIYERVLK